MNKRPEQTEHTRKQIVDAFWSLYEKRPIERITVKEIVAQVGCHRSTFYEYFDNVYQILESIEDALFEKLENELPKPPYKPESEEILKHHIDNFSADGRYLSVLVSEHGDPAFARRIQGLLAERLKPEFTTELSDSQARYIMQFSAGGFSTVMTEWLRSGRDLSVEDILKITHAFKDLEVKLLKGEVSLEP